MSNGRVVGRKVTRIGLISLGLIAVVKIPKYVKFTVSNYRPMSVAQ